MKDNPKLPHPKRACSEFLELKAQITKLEQRRDELKEFVIKPFLESLKDQNFLIDGWELSLAVCEGKETFDLKAAKEKIDGRTLAPYIKIGEPYRQLRTTFKGGK